LRTAERAVALDEKATLIVPELRGRLGVALGHRRLVGGVDLAIEPRQVRIGADRFFRRAAGRAAVERRQQIVRRRAAAPVTLLPCVGQILGGLVELRIDRERLLVIGDGVIEIALLVVGGAAIVVGEIEAGIERDGAVVIGDSAVVIALVIVGVAAIGQEIRLRPQPNGLMKSMSARS
jgi:hypothetical protein